MKKILALGLMFVSFAPLGAMAQVGIDPNANWGTPPNNVSPSGQLYSSADSGLSGGAGDVTRLVSFLGALLNIATQLILGAAVVYFLWGVFQFVKSAGDEEARQVGKNHIIYGVIGIAVMVSMWGLVNFVTGSINFGTTQYSVPSLLPMPK